MSSNYRDGHQYASMLPLSRRLRQNETDAEKAIWRVLRSREFGGVKFRRQHEFGPYILDFYCPARQLAIEVDGGQHDEPDQQGRDEKRERYLAARGIRTVRFSNLDVLQQMESVKQAIAFALETPSP